MIKLSLVNRQIKLLRPIEFNGTTFEDEALAREISGEIANVLTVGALASVLSQSSRLS
jgi:hypothetical protein